MVDVTQMKVGLLFFRENILQPYPIVTWNPEELAATPYDASLPSVFIVHDHEGTGTTTINPLLKDGKTIIHNDCKVLVSFLQMKLRAGLILNVHL